MEEQPRPRAVSLHEPASAEPLAESLRRIGRGDDAALASVIDTIGDAVYGVALRVVRDPELARDVAQEALLDVWRRAARFDRDAGTARSWILTIAHRRAVDKVRTEQAHHDRMDLHGSTLSATVETQDDVVDAAQRQWEAARVRRGLGGLTALQREALELAYYRGFTHVEVASALGIPLGTAKARIRDGLIRLRDAWEVES